MGKAECCKGELISAPRTAQRSYTVFSMLTIYKSTHLQYPAVVFCHTPLVSCLVFALRLSHGFWGPTFDSQ